VTELGRPRPRGKRCVRVNRDMLNLTRARRTALGICHVHVLDGGTVLRTFRALTPRSATRKATRYITHLKIEDGRSQHAEKVATKASARNGSIFRGGKME